uniref:Retron-type reverse transcriptase n=1 Tax=Desulfovibrio sp. U5L TaxID=596152 RepID=I2Q2M4_9BACT
MPRTHSDLFLKIVDFDNLWHAYLAARKGKRYRWEVAQFAAHLDENLINLQNHLLWGSWRPGAASEFTIREPKRREIQAPPFSDRVVHHALVRVVEPLFERRFIHHSYACRTGKGTQRAVEAVQSMARIAKRNWGTPYVVKADIKSFFASIRHETLFRLVGRVVSCPRTLALWRVIASGYGHHDGVGLPVGALTSQLGANLMLDWLDHVMTDQHGLGQYVRYMDDFVILAPSKAAAWERLEQAARVIAGLGLALNPKTAIFPLRSGVDFCGYRIWPTHILPRKRNIRRARRAFRSLAARYARGEIGLDYVWPRVASFLAYSKHCNAGMTVDRILAETVFQRGDHADR